ncbi:MAG: carboxypeptidase M32 [Cyanobacteriota bacterium]
MQVDNSGVLKIIKPESNTTNNKNISFKSNFDTLEISSIKQKPANFYHNKLISFGNNVKKNIEHKILLAEFYKQVGVIEDIQSMKYLAEWDRLSGGIPVEASESRSKHATTLENIFQEKIRNKKFGQVMNKLLDDPKKLSPRDKAMLRKWHAKHIDSLKTGSLLTEKLSNALAEASRVYPDAKKDSNFDMFAPYLEEVIRAKKDIAKAIDPDKSVYNALLERFEPGMTSEKLDKIFEELKPHLILLKNNIDASKSPEFDKKAEHILSANVDPEKATELYKSILTDMGFNFNRGKMATSFHPRSFKVSSPYDVRITISGNKGALSLKDFMFQLLAAMHEAGHGLVHQKADESLARTGLCDASDALHESQAILWEKLIGTSKPFWTHYYPELQKISPELKNVSLEDFYKAINKVQASLIRVKADEVTYNLHPILRHEIERKMLETKDDSELSKLINNLPEIWGNKTDEYLCIKPDCDKRGVLQDIHWSIGFIGGYFSTYALGNLMSAQFYQAAKTDLGKQGIDIEKEISTGNLNVLTEWLTKNIYKDGEIKTTQEVLKKATGEDLNIKHLVNYLNKKYIDIYSSGKQKPGQTRVHKY